MVILEVYDPCGLVRETTHHAPRLSGLGGKTICEVSNGAWETDRTFSLIRGLLKKQFPTAKIIPYTEFPVGHDQIDIDQIGKIVKDRGCQAAIVGNAGWGSCSTKAGRAAARIEKLGIPTFIVTRRGFTGIVNSAFGGLGFPADAATIIEFPIEMFFAGSDLSPIKENIDKIVYGLTKWKPTIKDKVVHAPAKVTVEGRDYQEAIANLNLLFLKNQWGDGLPILPATEECVKRLLKGTDLSPDTIVGTIFPRGGKPQAVILDIEEYQEILERLEDAEDLRMLEEMRRKPLEFKKLEDFLNEYTPSVWGLLRASSRTRLKRLSASNFQRIIPRIKVLAENPRPVGCRKISGSRKDWRIRVGNYRVIYEVEDEGKIVRVMRVRHRREAYH